ncbi:hypothetical protein ACSHT0_17305 [Tepidicaulis sp. LMO-SS28]|uniref:hypothetical protein n=1 Tax=Tepidicaulis sp. LMO-SS28 TaxID=3447455 RepID=UPI003EE211C8
MTAEFVVYGVLGAVLLALVVNVIDAARKPRNQLDSMSSKGVPTPTLAKKANRKRKKKKRGPIGGSHTAEIMMLGEDPVNRWAARKVRDKFF